MKKGQYGVRIKFNGLKIVDKKCDSIDEVDDLFKNVKRKFK